MTQPGPISARVARVRAGTDPGVLAAVRSGYVVLNERQPVALRGSCILLPDPVVGSLNDLDQPAREAFLGTMTLMGDAVAEVTGAERINYLVLCNQAPELHGHVIPRFGSEATGLRRQGPFEAYDFGAAPLLDAAGGDRDLVRQLTQALRRVLEQRLA